MRVDLNQSAIDLLPVAVLTCLLVLQTRCVRLKLVCSGVSATPWRTTDSVRSPCRGPVDYLRSTCARAGSLPPGIFSKATAVDSYRFSGVNLSSYARECPI